MSPVFPLLLHEIDEGLAVILAPGLVVKRLGDGGQCAVFTPGQSATDGGFLVARPYDEVVSEIEDVLREAEEKFAQEPEEAEEEDEQNGNQAA